MRKILFKNPLSPGDVIVSTAALRDLKRAHPDEFSIGYEGTCRELLRFNPYIDPLDPTDDDVMRVRMEYPAIHEANQKPLHFIGAYHQWMEEFLGVDVPLTDFHGDLPLDPPEKKWMSKIKELTGSDLPFWVVAAGGKFDFTTKWWPSSRYQEVVDYFQGDVLFVQVGESGHMHPALKGVIDLRGQTDIRQLLRLCHHAEGVLCPVTALMHMAAAVETRPDRPDKRPCVVIAGGREPVNWEHYPHHQFLHTVGALPCCNSGGCWKSRTVPRNDGNPKDKALCENPVPFSALVEGDPSHLPKCMDMVSVDAVVTAIQTYFNGGVASYLTSDQYDAARPSLSQ